MNRHLIFLLFCCLFFNLAFSQKENNNWCFGNNCGVDFNGATPVSFPGVLINTNAQEGCSSISDSLGNLLFYTDGITVWNRNHVEMPNGTGLLGDYSASQGALIVPKPGSSFIYYVFTVDGLSGTSDLRYSTVNMTLAGGLGDVTSPNVSLNTGPNCSEKMIGIFHSNGTDVWIIVHSLVGNNFYAFLVTSSGVSSTPVITAVGQIYHSTDAVGTMHCTLDGNRIAAAYWGPLSGFEVFDFDKSTGQLSNPLFLTSPLYYNAYSVCFSPSGRFLYGACFNTDTLFQFDLQSATPTGFLISNTSDYIGDLQLGPDSIIYTVVYGSQYLSAILNPDAAGFSCNFTEDYLDMGSGICQIGLANYVYPVVVPPTINVSFSSSDSSICPGSCINFSNNSINATSYQWLFPGGVPSSDSTENPQGICYLNSGTFDVTLIATDGVNSRTLTSTNFINVFTQTPFSPLIQIGDTLFSVPGYSSYRWYSDTLLIPGANDYFYVAPQNGDYSVAVIDSNGCTALATRIGVVTSLNDIHSEKDELFVRYSDESLYININSSISSLSLVLLTDVLGKIIFSDKIILEKGVNNFSLLVEDISKGIYFIKIKTSKSELTRKFIVN